MLGVPERWELRLFLSGLEDDLVRVAVTAEMDDLGLVLVELAQQVDRPRTRDQDQLHRVAERAAATSSSISRNSRGRSSGAVPRGLAAKSRTLIVSILTSDTAEMDLEVMKIADPVSDYDAPPVRSDGDRQGRTFERQGRPANSLIDVP